MAVAAVILAAGASSRLGEPKQLVVLAGERLLDRAVRLAAEAGCDPVVVVLGARAEEIRTACSLGTANVVINEDWAQGMASSIRCGIAEAHSRDGAIVMTCDQPAVTAAHLRQLTLCDTHGDTAHDNAPFGRVTMGNPGEAVASSYAGRRGVPAYFPAGYFSVLSELAGDSGARVLLETAASIDLPGGELDIDTPEALAIARQLYKG
jgi:CTP:molybdopterin cytidylyltransferase MocA